MSRRPDDSERERLLGAAVDYVVRTGRLDISLRPLAAALDRTPRTLLYHFGTRAALVAAIATEIQVREQALFAHWLRRGEAYGIAAFLLATWRWFAAPRRQPVVRLYLESTVVGFDGNAARSARLGAAADAWIDAFRTLLARSDVEADRIESLATLVHAVIRGLLLDLAATGDRARIDRAFRSFVRGIERPEPALE